MVTEPRTESALCELCNRAPVKPDDCFCVTCRIEVTAITETVNDPVAIILSRHQHLCALSNGDSTMCMCGEEFPGGPGYHRQHVATLIYRVLGLVGPLPNTPAAYEDINERFDR